ncbi:nucleotidyl transferase AbiEii/AbiGii toxin family protein [Patescibacteria group bacterium]|nr:nucleotidyl transferase AbiEii/AbiGii toxin family protein [Patescibacteria group bacterium]MBU1499949.1 nucleotidyl transferase AbiEii/AbiGii toxin family protein [Patescibacteria group bacterium]
MINLITLKELSIKKQIDQSSVFREILQIAWLNQFYRLPAGRRVWFKGGTCLKLLYGSNRFSEDLDFNTKLTSRQIAAAVNLATGKLQTDFPGLSVKPLKSIAGIAHKLYLPTEFSFQPLTVKLDFSLREKALLPEKQVISTDLPVLSVTLINHFNPREILAEKYRAILKRKKGRDIYDLWFLLNQQVPFDENLIRKKLRLYQEKYQPEKLIKRIVDFEEQILIKDVNQFLPKTDRQILSRLKPLLLQKLKYAAKT